jgi:hypothetical protein
MRSAHAYGCAKEAETSPWTQLAEWEMQSSLQESPSSIFKPYNDKRLKTCIKRKIKTELPKKIGHRKWKQTWQNNGTEKKETTKTEKRTDQREPTNTTGTKWGDDTNPISTKNRDLPTNLRKLIHNRGKLVSVLADGHWLFREVGKTLHT